MKNVSAMFKALGEPTRLEIVKLLAGKELCVCAILDAFQVTQPTISHHLNVLKKADLIRCKKEGQWVYYRLNKEAFAALEQFFPRLEAGDRTKCERRHR